MIRSEIVEKLRTHGCDISPGKMSVRIDPKKWDSDTPSVEIDSWIFYIWGNANPPYIEKSALKELALDLIEKGHGVIVWP